MGLHKHLAAAKGKLLLGLVPSLCDGIADMQQWGNQKAQIAPKKQPRQLVSHLRLRESTRRKGSAGRPNCNDSRERAEPSCISGVWVGGTAATGTSCLFKLARKKEDNTSASAVFRVAYDSGWEWG